MLSVLERKLLAVGYNAFDTIEKNTLIRELARREGVPYNQINGEYILEIHKMLKTREFSLISDNSIVKGFTSSNGHVYRTNKEDQGNMIGKAVQLLLDPTITHIYWKTEDVGYVAHTKEDWVKQVFFEGLVHKEQHLFKYNTLKQAISDATTHEELVNLQWDTWEAPKNEA